MTVEQLYQALSTEFAELSAAGKIFFDHIDVEPGAELLPDYMVITETEQDPFYADNVVYYLTIKNTLDVYTADYDAALINRVKKFLTDNGVAFAIVPVEWQDDIDAYLTSFEVGLDPSEDVES